MICGVSFDSVAENRAFRQKLDFPFPLLCDTERTLGLACGAADDAQASHARRITVVVGPDGKVVRVFDAVKPQEHAREVLAAL